MNNKPTSLGEYWIACLFGGVVLGVYTLCLLYFIIQSLQTISISGFLAIFALIVVSGIGSVASLVKAVKVYQKGKRQVQQQ